MCAMELVGVIMVLELFVWLGCSISTCTCHFHLAPLLRPTNQYLVLVVLSVVHKVLLIVASRIGQQPRVASNIYLAKDAVVE